MRTYYRKNGKVVGRAWSFIQCRYSGNHKPHVHDPMHASYGPYVCPGFPEKELYETPVRKPVNPKTKKT